MANLSKNKIPTAISRRTKLDLSFDHFTTQRFMEAQPVGYRHMIMGESINIEAIGTIRAAPLVVPTLGRMRCNLRGFFVPYRLVFKNWDAFYTDTIAHNYNESGIPAGVPYFTNRDVVNLFFGNYVGQPFVMQITDASVISAGAYDFVYNGDYYKFTIMGAGAIKILHSLGYRVNWDSKRAFRYNALALLAYARIYVDWYANQNYLDSAFIAALNRFFEFNDPTSDAHLGVELLSLILVNAYKVCYDDNAYFTGAYDTPSSPNPGLSSQFVFQDISDKNSESRTIVSTLPSGTPVMQQDDSNNIEIGTQYIHDALKMLTDYQKRHQLASALPISRWLAQFGAAPAAEKLKRSTYIGCKSFDVESGAVFSTTGGETLGDYAGHAEVHGSSKWQFNAEEFGILIFISSVIPSGGYYQGCDRHNYAVDKFDFFVPEADGLSVQAIKPSEVFMPIGNGSLNNQDAIDDHVFGYVGRYAHYKRPINFVTGAYDMPSQMLGGDSWHLQRRFNPAYFGNDVANIVHSLDFTIGKDAGQYHRIFNYTYADVEPFFSQYHFNIVAYAPCRPMMETYEFEDNGDKVTVDNGAIVN